MANFMGLFNDNVLTDIVDMLIIHRFSQDHPEKLFGCIRNMNGFNDNPTAQQFESAYRKLLVHKDIVCSKKYNCTEMGTKILTVSSHRPAQNSHTLAPSESQIDDSIFDYLESFYSYQLSDDGHSHSIAFKASMLEDEILKAKKPKPIIKCQRCINAFIENELMDDRFIRFKAGNSNITQPCKNTFEICKFIETFLKCYAERNISFDAALIGILRQIHFQSLYTSSNFDDHSDTDFGQRYEFVKQIVKMYMNQKSVHTAKTLTLKMHDEPIRHELKKMIHRAGQ